LFTSNDTSIRENIVSRFCKVNISSRKEVISNNVGEKRVPPPVPPCPSKEQIDKSKFHQQTHIFGGEKRHRQTLCLMLR